MSLYFDFALAFDLKPDTPAQVRAALAYVTRPGTDDQEGGPDLPPSDSFTWSELFRVEVTSVPGTLRRDFQPAYRYTQHGIDVYRDTFDVRTFVEVDALAEYLAFAEWVAPYSESRGCVGYFREESALHPVLIYFDQGTVDFLDIADVPAQLWSSRQQDDLAP